ncbi:MAG TPA: hypothetical protein VEM58_13565, partial [Streptosporangiaceae bacterium]|nr:hypothetical protein [Streptosporangiaceae bacterium]
RRLPRALRSRARPGTRSAGAWTGIAAARAARDFARSDAIRGELAGAGVTVEDRPGGASTWRWT